MYPRLFQGDINDVDADVIAIPIGTSLRPLRRVAQTVFQACHDSVAAGLAGRRAVVGDVILVAADGHPRARAIALAVVHDEDNRVHTEPSRALIADVSVRLLTAVDAAGFGTTLGMVPLNGYDLDAAEGFAATIGALRGSAGLKHLWSVIVVAREAETVDAMRELLRAQHYGVSASERSLSWRERDRTVPSARYGAPRHRKVSQHLELHMLMEACGSSELPVGCLGVAFRLRAQQHEVPMHVRVYADGASALRVFMDGLPLTDPRVRLGPGAHVLACEIDRPTSFAAEIAPIQPDVAARICTAPDGSVTVATSAPANQAWREANAPGADFVPVRRASIIAPAWARAAAVTLPEAERVWVRFQFPLLVKAGL